MFGAPTTQTRKRPSDYVPCLCNRLVVVAVVVLIACVIVATSVTLAVTLSSGSIRGSTSSSLPLVPESCDIPQDRRFDCFPSAPGAEMDANEERCKQRGCCWSPQESVKCYYPRGPRQVHLALTEKPDEMLVTWLKLGAANDTGLWLLLLCSCAGNVLIYLF